MRMIGFVNDEDQAQRFCDYLLTCRIASHVEQVSGGAWQVWVEDDDQLDPATAELAAFRATPDAPKYAATGQAQKLRKLESVATTRRRRNFRDVRTTMFSAPAAAAMPVAIGLVALGVLVSLATQFGKGGQVWLYHALLFTDHPEKPLVDFKHGQLWRLITPIFIHYDVLHILFNALWVLDLGRRVESVRGSLRFAGLVLVIGVLSCVAQAVWDYSRFGGVGDFGGLSGVVFGLFGYAWMCSRLRPWEGIRVNGQEVGLMLGWLVLCSLGFVGAIANAAHLGGLLVGMALGAGPALVKRRG